MTFWDNKLRGYIIVMEKWKKIREKSGFSRKGGTKETREKRKKEKKEGRKE